VHTIPSDLELVMEDAGTAATSAYGRRVGIDSGPVSTAGGDRTQRDDDKTRAKAAGFDFDVLKSASVRELFCTYREPRSRKPR
jgi:hypothetical protein